MRRLDEGISGPYIRLTLFVSLAIAVAVRFPYLVSEDLFPIGDGGLFVAMINAIKANHYFLPKFVEYNHVQIPFTYPPLGFYLAIIFSRIFGLPTLLVVRYLPLILNLLTVAVFVLVGSELLTDTRTFFLSSLIFSMILQVYLWTIKGGGLSRSPGFLFTALALYFLCLYERKDLLIYFFLTIFSLSGAVLSHPEWAFVALMSIAVLLLVKKTNEWRKNFHLLLKLYVGAAILTFPWWGVILFRFGFSPFMMAGQVASFELSQFIQKFLAGGFLFVNVTLQQDFLLPLFSAIGIIISLYRGDFLLPVWLVALYIVSPKNAPIPGLIPLTLLTGIGLRSVDDVLSWGFRYLSENGNLSGRFRAFAQGLLSVSIGILYILLVALLGLMTLTRHPVLHPIKQNHRAAMQFIADNTPDDTSFVVLTPTDWFEADSAEWFPLLADRKSLTTPQGLEWVSSSEFTRIGNLTYDLSSLVRSAQAGNDTGELAAYVESHFDDYGYVAVFANDLSDGFGGFLATGRFDILYSKKDVLIFSRIAPLE